jgi:hypothetical protein
MQKMTNKNTNKVDGETPNFYPKLLDKDGNVINIGDVLYGEDGRAWEIEQVRYGENLKYPLVGRLFIFLADMDGCSEIDEFYNPTRKELSPKWLSRKNPKPKPSALDADTLDEWMADLQGVISELPVGDYPLKNNLYKLKDKMRQVAERETKEDK